MEVHTFCTFFQLGLLKDISQCTILMYYSFPSYSRVLNKLLKNDYPQISKNDF